MSEKKESQKIFDIEVFKEDIIITIEVPVAMVTRLNQLLLEFIPFKDEEHFLTTMKNIADKKFDDPFAYHTSTIMFLMNMLEDAARKQDKLQWVRYNADTNEKEIIEKK